MPYEIRYDCQRCTACCRWPGVVRVEEREIAAIAAFLGMDEGAFIDRHTRLRPDRTGLSLLDLPDGRCEWLHGEDCAIQAVKLQQCKGFPNAWAFPGWREKCHAIPRLVPRE